jgi:hypothetical protein
LEHTFASVSAAASQPFRAGQLSRERIERILSFALSYDIPLRLHEVKALSDQDLIWAIEESNRKASSFHGGDEALRGMFDKLVASGALVLASERNLHYRPSRREASADIRRTYIKCGSRGRSLRNGDNLGRAGFSTWRALCSEA